MLFRQGFRRENYKSRLPFHLITSKGTWCPHDKMGKEVWDIIQGEMDLCESFEQK